MRKHPFHFAIGLFALFAMTVGCAITDYDGIPNHKTTGEAKIWGKGVAFTGFGANLDGSYDYTVKYDNTGVGSGTVAISSYRIPGLVSFNRDGLVDRDGDDVQGNSGDAGGKWTQWVRAYDNGNGTCEFNGNFLPPEARMWDNGDIGVALCISGFEEEIDKDHSLQADFASLDDLFSQIWSGMSSTFTAEVTSITLNGTLVDLTNAMSVDLRHNGLRPINMAVDGSSPGAQELLQAILDNTTHLEATTIGLGFSGGLSFTLPGGNVFAFNHDMLAAALQ